MLKIKSLLLGIFLSTNIALALTDKVIDNAIGLQKINISRSDVNRLVFPSKVISEIISQEKNLQVQKVDNNVFLKFTPIKVEKVTYKQSQLDGSKDTVSSSKIDYSKSKPSELIVVTKDKTYSMILYPRKINSQTVYFTETFKKRVKELNKLKESEYVELISNKIIKPIIQKQGLYGFEKVSIRDSYKQITKDFLMKSTYRFEGLNYKVYQFQIKNISNKIASIIDPKPFLFEGLKKYKLDVKSYAFYYGNRIYKAFPNNTVELIIVSEGN